MAVTLIASSVQVTVNSVLANVTSGVPDTTPVVELNASRRGNAGLNVKVLAPGRPVSI